MTPDLRPRRSALYVPGSNARALEKARTLPADLLILDLEDAVAPEAKAQAREQALAALAQGYAPREALLRVNGLDAEQGEEDLRAAARSGADGVVLPKVESAAAVAEAESRLAAAGAPAELKLWCMIETPLGALNAAAIAAASPRLAGLIMGAVDLTRALQARRTPGREALLPSLGLCLLAARAHGLAILDGVHPDLEDEAGFVESCRQGRDLGFDGKTLIHPKTIAAANAMFAPDEGEVAEARRILAVYDAARAAGQGVALLDGRLVEKPIADQARRVVALAEAIARRET